MGHWVRETARGSDRPRHIHRKGTSFVPDPIRDLSHKFSFSKEFLKKEFSQENIEFWVKCENFKNIFEPNKVGRHFGTWLSIDNLKSKIFP
jgi:hypothetical protein